MVVLIDTNVLLDFLLGREPYFSNADRIIKLCAEQKISEVPAVIPEDFLKVVQC